MRRIRQLALIAMILISPDRAFAHGVVGDYTFLEPIVAEDANPKNEWDLLAPTWVRTADGRQFSLGSSLEKKLAENASLTIATAWLAQSPRHGPYRTGFNDLDLLLKWAFLTIREHEFRLSIGAQLVLPTGNADVEDQNHAQMGPEFLWAKGFGDLPNQGLVKYLRPFGVQGDFAYLPALGGSTWHHMFADNVIEYSLSYLSDSVEDIGLKWPLRNLYLYTEFNYDQLNSGPAHQTFPQILVTPGIAYMDSWLELSFATQLALNRATVPNNHAAILGLLDLFIDDIFPTVNWTPL